MGLNYPPSHPHPFTYEEIQALVVMKKIFFKDYIKISQQRDNFINSFRNFTNGLKPIINQYNRDCLKAAEKIATDVQLYYSKCTAPSWYQYSKEKPSDNVVIGCNLVKHIANRIVAEESEIYHKQYNSHNLQHNSITEILYKIMSQIIGSDPLLLNDTTKALFNVDISHKIPTVTTQNANSQSTSSGLISLQRQPEPTPQSTSSNELFGFQRQPEHTPQPVELLSSPSDVILERQRQVQAQNERNSANFNDSMKAYRAAQALRATRSTSKAGGKSKSMRRRRMTRGGHHNRRKTYIARRGLRRKAVRKRTFRRLHH